MEILGKAIGFTKFKLFSFIRKITKKGFIIFIRLRNTLICPGCYQTGRQVWKFYLTESQAVCDLKDNPTVLKTDLWNESNNIPKIGGVCGNLKNVKKIFAIERQSNLLLKAKKNLRAQNIEYLLGDIRSLPFNSKFFDIVLDLSTLDHIPPSDAEKVLSEYYRVLKKNGLLLLVVWTTSRKVNSESLWSPNKQYFLKKSKLEDSLKKYFKVLKKKIIFLWPDNTRNKLYYYFCESK